MNIITGLRKFLNFPNRLQKGIISIQFDMIEDKCRIIANEEYQDMLKSQVSHDNNCPNCRAKKDQIVNKIRNVQSNGSIGGSWFLVHSSYSIETTEVNHCIACGNEWKKFKSNYATTDDITRVALRYLREIIEDDSNKQYSWKVKTIAVFDETYAESINELFEINKSYFSSNPKLSTLRKYYSSVYNRSVVGGESEEKKLEKL